MVVVVAVSGRSVTLRPTTPPRISARHSTRQPSTSSPRKRIPATAASAEGGTSLNAFDNALLAAGIGNINLIKVSSIVPPEVSFIELPKIKPGAVVPTAYAAMTSETPGETVAAAVGYAVTDDPAKNGGQRQKLNNLWMTHMWNAPGWDSQAKHTW